MKTDYDFRKFRAAKEIATTKTELAKILKTSRPSLDKWIKRYEEDLALIAEFGTGDGDSKRAIELTRNYLVAKNKLSNSRAKKQRADNSADKVKAFNAFTEHYSSVEEVELLDSTLLDYDEAGNVSGYEI